MALKDWEKIGSDEYKLKSGIGKVWIDVDSNTERKNGTAIRGANKYRYITTYRYIFYHHYMGDGGHPDPKIFDTKAKAHAHLMKHVKTKDY